MGEANAMTSPSPTEETVPPDVRPYMLELRFQASAAAHLFQSLEEKVKERKRLAEVIQRINRDGGPPPLEMERLEYQRHLKSMANLVGPILGDVQGFFAALGVIASILWPSERKFRDESDEAVNARVRRGAEIRRILGVREDSKLKTRTGRDEDVRGGLLHFDEMIDEFAQVQESDNFVPLDIGSSKLGTALARSKAVRWLDEDSLDLWVNGRQGNLRQLREELQRTVGKIQLSASLDFVSSARRAGDAFPFGMSLRVSSK